MKTHWLILFSAQFVLAQPATVHSRATYNPEMAMPPAVLELRTPNVSRDDLGPKIMQDKVIRECLRQSLMNAGDDFRVQLSGHVDAKGNLTGTQAETFNTPPLAQCMQDAVNALKLKSKGTAGDFQITIERYRITGREAKTYTLDLYQP